MTETYVKLAEALEQLREKPESDEKAIQLVERHLQNYESPKKKVVGGLTYQGRSVEEALNELLYAKSNPKLYIPEPAPVPKTKEDILIEQLEKKIERLRYLMHRSKKRRKRVKLAIRILELYERIDDLECDELWIA